MNIHDLNRRFAIPDGLKIVPGAEGDERLPVIEVQTPTCTGRVSLQGGHILDWQPVGQAPVLFVSSKAKYLPGVAIRGGIPVCFPWFGPPPTALAGKPETAWAAAKLPAHGIARTRLWELEATRKGDGKIAFVLLLKSNEETRRIWPFDFELRLRLTFGGQLIIKLETKNTGNEPFTFQEALHTYFAMGDVRKTRLSGLENLEYYDQLAGMQVKKEALSPSIHKQIDRIYITPLNIQASGGSVIQTIGIEDPVLGRRITMEEQNSGNAVLWNPGPDKVLTFSDMAAEEWPKMLCIETANILPQPITLEPGVVHQMRLTLSAHKY